jgi:hypothetical protein
MYAEEHTHEKIAIFLRVKQIEASGIVECSISLLQLFFELRYLLIIEQRGWTPCLVERRWSIMGGVLAAYLVIVA